MKIRVTFHFRFRLVSCVRKSECLLISYFPFSIARSIIDNLILYSLRFSLFFLLHCHILFFLVSLNPFLSFFLSSFSIFHLSIFLFSYFPFFFIPFFFLPFFVFLFQFSLFLFLFSVLKIIFLRHLWVCRCSLLDLLKVKFRDWASKWLFLTPFAACSSGQLGWLVRKTISKW